MSKNFADKQHLIDRRIFKVEKNDKKLDWFTSKPTNVFYTVMDYLSLYHAGYYKAGTKLAIHLDIPEFLVNDSKYMGDTMNIIQEDLKEFIQIFGSDTDLTTSKTASESGLIVTIYKV